MDLQVYDSSPSFQNTYSTRATTARAVEGKIYGKVINPTFSLACQELGRQDDDLGERIGCSPRTDITSKLPR